MNNITPQNPLTKEQIDGLRQQIKAIPQIKANIAAAKQAGIDVSEYEQQLTELETKAKAFIAVYGKL